MINEQMNYYQRLCYWKSIHFIQKAKQLRSKHKYACFSAALMSSFPFLSKYWFIKRNSPVIFKWNKLTLDKNRTLTRTIIFCAFQKWSGKYFQENKIIDWFQGIGFTHLFFRALKMILFFLLKVLSCFSFCVHRIA